MKHSRKRRGERERELAEEPFQSPEDDSKSAQEGIYPSIQQRGIKWSTTFFAVFSKQIWVLSLQGTVEGDRERDGDTCELDGEPRPPLQVKQRQLAESVLHFDDAGEFGVEGKDASTAC